MVALCGVDEAKFEKLQKHLKHNTRLVKAWGSPPKKIEMPTEGGRSLGFAFLEFETPVRPFLSPPQLRTAIRGPILSPPGPDARAGVRCGRSKQ